MIVRKLAGIALVMPILLCSLNAFGFSRELTSDLEDAVVLFANSNLAYANNKDTYIDVDNKEVRTVVKNGRTLIPLRFIAENFGAKVSYDAPTKTATINVNNTVVKFTSDSNSMLVDGKKITMDVPAQIVNGRMLVPLRALTENALNKQIFYEKGVIVISQSQKSFNAEKVEELVANFRDPFEYQLTKPSKGDIVAVMKTNMGTIKIKLFHEDAPMAVENFVRLSQKGYYNGVSFHRVIQNFMIQSGDPQGTGRGGESIWGEPFPDEISKRLYNIRGALSMANRGPDTNGSQFFIVQAPSFGSRTVENYVSRGMERSIINKYSKIGGAPWLDGGYTVFGQVYEGMEVVDKIAAVEVNNNDKPVESVYIVEVKTYKVGQENQPVVFEKSAYTPGSQPDSAASQIP